MNTLVFLRRPLVPGFCPSMGAVFTLVGRRGPRPGAAVMSTLVFSNVLPGRSLGSSDELLKVTAPLKTQERDIHTSPVTASLVQPTREGMPPLVAASSWLTSLYFFLSRLTMGALPPQRGLRTGLKSSVMTYASERSRRRSSHFLTGAKRVRGTTMAVAPLNTSMAAPMAVSSWMTFWLASSLGSTVFLFLIIGRGMKPPNLSMVSLSLSSLIHRLLVLK
mmetsp:Transcript_20197/g.42084  ORF Transcript_20197/g.42084 Transcript_20197/m.42084 type:complete len:220 (-) Transcript_20197:943-1602(-)